MSFKQTIFYGIVVAVVIFFIGWSTGMGGDFWPNIIFSGLMGVLAMIAIKVLLKIPKNK
jgi:hypothetical protein